MKGKKRNKDNKGMSLVEVIIAITILSVVIIPVFQALTTAMVYNSKARVRQNLTLTAESIMETFKGYSLESLTQMFGGSGETIAGVNGGTYSYTTPTYNEAGEEQEGAYDFTIAGFSQNGKSYNAEISVVPNGTQEVYEVRDISTTTNAVFQGDRSYDKNLKNSMYNSYIGNSEGEVDGFYSVFSDIDDNEAGYSDSDEYNYMGLKIYPGSAPEGIDITTESLKSDNIKNYITIYDRTTTVEVNGTSATVSIEYHYKIENYPYVVMLEKKPRTVSGSGVTSEDVDLTPDLTFGGESSYTEESKTIDEYPSSEYLTYKVAVRNPEIYNNTEKLERLYMYYYPLYETEGSSLIKDIIKVKNNAGIDFNLYMIKQVAADLSNNKIEIGEGAYSPSVELSGSGSVYVYHNLKTNIATGDKNLSGYTISSAFAGEDDYTASSEFVKQEMLNYLVTVKISDGTNYVSELESSMNEKIKSVVTTTTTTTETETSTDAE